MSKETEKTNQANQQSDKSSQVGGGKGSNLTEEAKRKGGEHSHGGGQQKQ